MKTKSVLFALTLLFTLTAAHATIRTVSNNNNSPGQYTDFASAHTASSNGDTIYVSGSPYNYNTFAVSKRLTIVGTGHNPQKQAPLRSFVDYVYFYTGSNGAKVIGMEVYYFNTQAGDIDNIEIRNCKITYQIYAQHGTASNWIIDGNVFVYTAANIRGTCNQDGFRIRNNVLNGSIENFSNCQNNYHYVENNIFLRNADAFADCYMFYVNNNVFYRANPYTSGVSATYSNNISYQCTNNGFPNGTNQTNVNPQFVSFPNAGAYFDYSYNFNITNGSPADNGGTDGTDMGVYGGSGDYDRDGLPRLPYIASYNIANPTISPGGTLNVTFKSKIR
jgi:hypothetical protein